MKQFISYAAAFDIAGVAMKDYEQRGRKFRPGAQRAAALAAVQQCSKEAVIDAIRDVLEEHRDAIDATGWAEAAFEPRMWRMLNQGAPIHG